MAFVGLVFSKGALELMGTPEDVIGLSTLYMRIYFMGMPFFMLYNYGAAILRAVGDTKRPLYFLIIAGVINAGLNMVLVIVFGLGVAGVGIATCKRSFSLRIPPSSMTRSAISGQGEQISILSIPKSSHKRFFSLFFHPVHSSTFVPEKASCLARRSYFRFIPFRLS